MSENEIEGRMSAEDSEDSEGDERSCPDSFEHEKMVLILAREKDTRPHLATMRRRDLTGIPRDELRRAVYIGLNSSAIMKGYGPVRKTAAASLCAQRSLTMCTLPQRGVRRPLLERDCFGTRIRPQESAGDCREASRVQSQ
jgi:hypothetical protein